MQLKNKSGIRRQLALATSTLLAAGAVSAGGQGEWEVDSALLIYSELDRVTVVEPAVEARKALGEDGEEYLGARLIFDAMTGSSPNGASATSAPQTFTTPSGETFTAGAGETPLRGFRDQRVALGLSWDKQLTRMLRGVFGADVSGETDYQSYGANATLALDVNNRLTTLTAGIGLTQDTINPEGGVPIERALTADGDPRPFKRDSSDSKQTTDLLLGVTQVLSRHTLTQLNYSLSSSSGYLTDPYKLVSVVDGVTGQTVNYRFESRPDARQRQAMMWTTAHHFEQDVLHVGYRYFWDDWGITAHTLDVKYRYELGSGHYLMPQLRYSRQGAADFYRHSVVNGQPLEHASADYRLGEMTTTTLGLKYGQPLGRGELRVRLEWMRQQGDSHPADAIGVQKDIDLFPTVDAVIFNVGYDLKF